MPGVHTAESELVEKRKERARLEERMVAALSARDVGTVAATEHAIAAIADRVEELEAVLEHVGERRVLQNVPDLWRVCYLSARRDTAQSQPLDRECIITDGESPDIPLGLDAFATDVGRWSVRNLGQRVTSATVATGDNFYGIIEGPKAVTQQLMETIAADTRHSNVTILSEHASDSRLFTFGATLSTVSDGVLARVLDECTRVALRARAFAPASAVDITRRGGHPLAIVPNGPKPFVAYAVMLDGRCGAVHRAERYVAAATTIAALVAKHGGSVVDSFGEVMTAWFPILQGPTEAAKMATLIHATVPFAVQALHAGDLVVVDSPDVLAFGPALDEVVALLHLAERLRRPVVLSHDAGERVNRARQPLESFTADNVNYFTLGHLGMERLEMPPEPALIGAYNPPPEPVEHEPAVHDAAADSTAARRSVYVRGARTNDDLIRLFRKLDKGNAGWVGKDAFRHAVATDEEFPRCPDELAENALRGWLDRCNKLGESRLGFNEFAIVCLKLDSL
jgi:hypothetical protein